MKLFDKTCFHDASIDKLEMCGKSIEINFENAGIDEVEVSGSVHFDDVEGVIVDNMPANGIHMECEYGRILTLRREGAVMLLIIRWQDFGSKRKLTRSYRFSCSEVRCQVTDATPCEEDD